MPQRVCIPDSEYAERIERAARLAGKQGLDVLIANSNEADYANCRYFSGYWPLFEIGGVAIAPNGQAALMTGPESETYALSRSKISNIHQMTELQVVGIIQHLIYEYGAEYEAHPQYVFSNEGTRHAISRPTYHVLEKGDFVQLDIGARVDGYSPSVGRPICLGKMTPRQRELVEFGREAHYKTYEWISAGVIASEVAKKYIELFKDRGYGSNYLYGPCHGLGMIEVEPPWMETSSDYPLQENMTFQADTFLYDAQFGLRWENGLRVTADGAEMMSKANMEIIELE